MKTATKLRENRFDTFVAKTSVSKTTIGFLGYQLTLHHFSWKNITTQKKQFKNAIEIIPFFFQALNDTVWILNQDRINFLNFAQDRNYI